MSDFRVSGASAGQLLLSTAMFQNFAGDDAFDLIGSGYLRVQAGQGSTSVQIDADGGGNGFQTLAVVDGTLTNGLLADHTLLI